MLRVRARRRCLPLALVDLRLPRIHLLDATRRRAAASGRLLVRHRPVRRRRVLGLRQPARSSAACRRRSPRSPPSLFCAFLALFPARRRLAAGAHAGAAAVRACLLIPAAWTLFEWLRGWMLHRLSLARGRLCRRSAGRCRAMRRSPASIGVSFAHARARRAAVAGWCAAGARRLRARAIVALLVAGEALRHVAVDRARPARRSRVALLQGNVAQEMKFRPERYARTLETYARLAEETEREADRPAGDRAAAGSTTASSPAYLARLEAAARRNGGDLLLGVPYRAARRRLLQQRRHARRLAAPDLPQDAPGAVRRIHPAAASAGCCSCLRHPAVRLRARRARPAAARGRRPARRGQRLLRGRVRRRDRARGARDATLLVNMSNVAWFGDSLAPAQHLQIARLRAIETGRMHLAATNTGVTAAIDRDGARARRACRSSPKGASRSRRRATTALTPYLRSRDWPIARRSRSRCSPARCSSRGAGSSR